MGPVPATEALPRVTDRESVSDLPRCTRTRDADCRVNTGSRVAPADTELPGGVRGLSVVALEQEP